MSTGRRGTTPAPSGHVWVCLACGKTSATRYGIDEHGHHVAMFGWDESCMLNAALVAWADIDIRSQSGRVHRLRDGAVVRTAREMRDERREL